MKKLFVVTLAALLVTSGTAQAATTGEQRVAPVDGTGVRTDPDAKAAKAAAAARHKRIRAKAHRNAARAKANARAMQVAGDSK
ncbi:MAG: hypothetical protein H7234_07475 [Herminiimonas sp.]|nr:hypothetical protein [Herminiimonas sp.]